MKKQITFIIAIFLCSILLAAGMYLFKSPEKHAEKTSGYRISEENLLSPIDFSKPKNTGKTSGQTTDANKKTSGTSSANPLSSPETQIYSYLQGPKSWENKRTWSGKWGVTYYDGAKFGAFGCGLCCIANLYCSLTPYKCTPIDAYKFAKKHTGYSGGGAIDWGYMKTSLSMMGLSCTLEKKPATYKAFQKMIAANAGTITLISSNNSTCYWTSNPGHYVTIFLYNPKTDKVFLADSGVPDHNRKWISLKLIYKSLKTASTWHMLGVTGYSETDDTWKHKAAGGEWVRE